MKNVKDIDGVVYKVTEERVYLGVTFPRGYPVGECARARVICTTEVAEFLKANYTDPEAMSQVPIGSSVVMRFRHRFGLYPPGTAHWWKARLDDLKTLKSSEFVAKHGGSRKAVDKARGKYIGRRNRKAHWWQSEENKELLRGTTPRQEVAKQLGIALSSVDLYRTIIRQTDGQPHAVCLQCGKSFVKPALIKPPSTCSDECNAKLHKEQRKEQSRRYSARVAQRRMMHDMQKLVSRLKDKGHLSEQ